MVLKFKRKIEKKKKIINTERILFDNENINSHLIEYTINPDKYNIYNLLIYLFKVFSSNSCELFSKLKVLTMKDKIEYIDNNNVSKNIMICLFKLLNMDDDFNSNLLNILYLNNQLSNLVSNFFFKSEMTRDNFEIYFDLLINKVIVIYDRLDNESSEVIINLIDNFKKSCENDILDNENIELKYEDIKDNIQEKAVELLKEEVVNDDNSDFSLISLTDDAKIAELDKKFEKIFSKDEISPDNIIFATNLILNLEKLVKNNEIYDINLLWKILYCSKFNYLIFNLKFLIKAFICKIGNMKVVYKIYEKVVQKISNSYIFFNIFFTLCENDFELENFIKKAILNRNSDLLIHRINREDFYKLYTHELDKCFDEFYIELIISEKNINLLKLQLEKEKREYFIEIINKRISKLEKNINSINKNKNLDQKNELKNKNKNFKDKNKNLDQKNELKNINSIDKNNNLDKKNELKESNIVNINDENKNKKIKRNKKKDNDNNICKKNKEKVSNSQEKNEIVNELKEGIELTNKRNEIENLDKIKKPKKTFKDKIGYKIFEERMEKKKKFKLENSKIKRKLKKEKRKLKKGNETEDKVKITKRSLRDQQIKNKKKK